MNTKLYQYGNLSAKTFLACVFLLLSLVFVAGSASASTVGIGYNTADVSLKVGMVAGLTDAGNVPAEVERADSQKWDRVIGVVTDSASSALTVTSADSRVIIATSGQVPVYVSDINGTVKSGDQLVLSPLRGILMKAARQSPAIVGVATQDLSLVETKQISALDKDKNPIKTQVGLLQVSLDVKLGGNPDRQSFLQRLGKSLTNKDISALRVIGAIVIFLMLLVVEGSIIYSAVKNSLTAIGRNPMARAHIGKSFMVSLLVSLIILIFAAGGIYAMLFA